MLLFSKTKILIVEEEEMFRTILVRYCQMWEYSVVGSCDNGRDGLILSVRLKPDVVLIEPNMPDYDGFDVVKAIQLKVPEIKVLILTNVESQVTIRRALKLRVNGIIDKRTDSFDNIGKVVPEVLSGKKYFSPKVREIIRDLFPDRVSQGTL